MRLAAHLGCAVATVDGVEAALEACASHPPEAVLVDAASPHPGIQLVRSLRATREGRHLAIVVLLGQHTREDASLLRDAGADVCVQSPVATYELARALLGVTMMKGAEPGSYG